MTTADIRNLVIRKDLAGLEKALSEEPLLASKGWPADENNPVLAHPLHRICDEVYNGTITDADSIDAANVFLNHGADINGNVTEEKNDTPLVAAASLNAERLGLFYIDRGANIFHAGCHGGTALHWAAWCGKDLLVERLITEGSEINRRCIDFKSTPLFWAIHGFVNFGKENREHYTVIVKALTEAGADKTIPNIDGNKPSELLEPGDELLLLLQDN